MRHRGRGAMAPSEGWRPGAGRDPTRVVVVAPSESGRPGAGRDPTRVVAVAPSERGRPGAGRDPTRVVAVAPSDSGRPGAGRDPSCVAIDKAGGESRSRPVVFRVSITVRAVGTLALAFVLGASMSALAQGPMSSGYKPNAATSPPSAAQPPTAAAKDAKGALDVNKLFASTCGWCHSNGGRTAGKGPQLMGTTLTDAEIANRIRNGKPGQMPAFGSAFSDDDIKAIIRYIRDLKEA